MSFFPASIKPRAVYFVQAMCYLFISPASTRTIIPKGSRTSINNRQACASPHLDYSDFIMRQATKHEAGIPVNMAGLEASNRVKYQPTSPVTDPMGTVYYDNGLVLIPINGSFPCRG